MAPKLAQYQIAVFSCLFVGYALYTLCRKSFGFVIPAFVETENLSKEDIGIILSSLNAAYAVSKFIIGVLSDHVSARILFSLGLALSGASLLGFSRAGSLPVYVILWFINGLVQGCGWPACAKLLRKWFKPAQLGTVWSLLSASMNVTGAIVPLILPLLLALGNGWRGFMLISGVLSVISAFIALVLVRDSPSDCGLPEVTPDAKKDEGRKTQGHNEHAKWSTLLASSFLWRLSFYYFATYMAKTVCENWAQLLIVEEKGLSVALAATFVSTFEMGGMISSFATGYLTDWVMQRQAASAITRNPRMSVALCYMLISCVALASTAATSALLPLTAFILGAAIYGNINIFGIVATEEAPVHLSGSSHAVVGLAANVGAILAGYPFSILVSATSLTSSFYFLSAVCFMCLLILVLTHSRSTKIAHID